MPQNLWFVKFYSGNGLVPDPTKQLPEQKLTKLYDPVWCH